MDGLAIPIKFLKALICCVISKQGMSNPINALEHIEPYPTIENLPRLSASVCHSRRKRRHWSCCFLRGTQKMWRLSWGFGKASLGKRFRMALASSDYFQLVMQTWSPGAWPLYVFSHEQKRACCCESRFDEAVCIKISGAYGTVVLK